jgi:transcriptional regulator with XRE-family HTH domain
MGSAKKPPRVIKRTSRGSGKEDIQLGGRLRALRIDRKMSQQELGEALGVSFQQVQKYEKGVNRVSAVRLNQIAKLLKVSSDDITGFTGPQVDGFEFDIESYKLAKAFSRLPDHLKSKFRNLISSITDPPE